MKTGALVLCVLYTRTLPLVFTGLWDLRCALVTWKLLRFVSLCPNTPRFLYVYRSLLVQSLNSKSEFFYVGFGISFWKSLSDLKYKPSKKMNIVIWCLLLHVLATSDNLPERRKSICSGG